MRGLKPPKKHSRSASSFAAQVRVLAPTTGVVTGSGTVGQPAAWVGEHEIGNGTASGALPTWHTVGDTDEPAFLNGWVDSHAQTSNLLYPTQFCLASNGWVHMRGAVTQTSGTAGVSPFFTLPAGYRPASKIISIVRSYISDTALRQPAFLYVDADGNVGIDSIANWTLNANNGISLEQISFLAEQ